MKILVTGGTGYIGSHVTVELLNQGYDVTIIDNLANSKISVLNSIEKIAGKKPEFHQINLLDYNSLEQLFSSNTFDLVMHVAALKSVAESTEKPLLYYENNLYIYIITYYYKNSKMRGEKAEIIHYNMYTFL